MAKDISTAKSLVEKSAEILVLLPQNPGPDSIASALGLFLGLEQAGKQAHIACGTPIDFSQYPLKHTEKITQKIGNKNLVISLKVDSRDSVDKVSYNLDEATKVFNLIVTPKKGASPLDSNAVSFSMAGARADLIIVVGATSFDDLGSLYAAEPGLFTETSSIAINRMEPVPFATYHLANDEASSIAEWMTTVIEELGLPLSADAATNLLAAIDVVTNKLQLPSVKAATFENVAKLIRAGGARVMLMPRAEVKPLVAPIENTTPMDFPQNNIDLSASPVEAVPEDWLSPPKILKAPKTS